MSACNSSKLRSFSSLAVLPLAALLLTLFGCTRGGEIESSVPANGSTGVSSALSQIEVQFSTGLDNDSATNPTNVTVTGEQSGSKTVSLELMPLGTGDTAAEGRRLVISPMTGDDFAFMDGELVVVGITSGITSVAGVAIQSGAIAFEISGISGDPSDFEPSTNQFLVQRTDPEANSARASLRQPIMVDFDTAAFPEDFASSLVVRGSVTGFRFGGDFSTASSTVPVNSFTYMLDSMAASFAPGETVTVTLGPGIEAPSSEPSQDPQMPNPNRALRPYSFDFGVKNGEMAATGGGFQDPVQVNASTGQDYQNVVGAALSTEFLFQDGAELAILDQQLGLALLRQSGAAWVVESTSDDYNGVPVAMRMVDLDHGRGPDLVVALRDPNQILVFRYAAGFSSVLTYAIDLPAEQTPRDLEVADLDNDGDLDLVVATARGLFIYSQLPLIPMDSDLDGFTDRHNVTGWLPLPVTVASNDTTEVEVGDFDGDGRLDLAVVEQALGLGIYRNASNLSLLRVAALDGSFAGEIEVADLEGDGDLDVIFPTGTGVGAYLTDPSLGSTEATVPIASEPTFLTLPRGAPDSFAVRDVSGDGMPDLISYHRGESKMVFFPRSAVGVAGLADAVELDVPNSLADSSFLLADSNQDGGLDLILFGASGDPGTAVTISNSTGITAPEEDPEFAFQVPAQVTGQLGDAEFSVLVRGDISESVTELDLRMEFDGNLELSAISLDPTTFADGAATIDTTLEAGIGRARISLGTFLAPGTDVPLARFVFRLRTPVVGTYTYRLRNGDVLGESVLNSVLLVDSSRITVDLASASSGEIQVDTSVLGVENLTCIFNSTTELLEAAWDIPAGVAYDPGLGGIQISLNGGAPQNIVGGATAAAFDDWTAGANTVSVVGFQNGLASAPVDCEEFVIPAPTDFMAQRISSVPPRVTLSWTNNGTYDRVRLARDGTIILNALENNFLDTTASPNGGHIYTLVAIQDFGGQEEESAEVSATILDEDGIVTVPDSIQLTFDADEVTLSWLNAEFYNAIEVFRDGSSVANLAGAATTYTDTDVPPGLHVYTVEFTANGVTSPPVSTTPDSVETTLPGPTSVVCLLSGSDVSITWVNNALYDSISILRTDNNVRGDGDSFILPGTATSFDDLAVPEGNYTYQIEGFVGSSSSGLRGDCSIVIQSEVTAPNLLTSLGLTQEPIDIRGDVLVTTTDFSFTLEYDPSRLQLGASPTVLLASGVALPASAISDVAAGQLRQLTVTTSNAFVSPGTDVLLATILGDIPADFDAVGTSPLRLVDATLGGFNPELSNGSLLIAGDSMIVFSDLAVSGQLLDVTVFGTFDQRITAYTLLMQYDPSVVELIEITSQSTIGEVVDNAQFFGLNTFDNTIGIANPAFIDLTIPPQGSDQTTLNVPPAINAPLFHFLFEVNSNAPDGADTGIRLAFPADFGDDASPLQASFVSQAAQNVFPIFINGGVSVAEDPSPDLTTTDPDPAEGAWYGGNSLTLQGTSLLGENLQVLIGSQPAQINAMSATSLSVTVPGLASLPTPAADVSVDITVIHADGSSILVNGYTYRQAVLNAVSPSQGAAGQAVTLEGSFFGSDQTTAIVRFGGVDATVQGVNTAGTEIGAIVPAGTGSVDLELELPGQTLALAGAFDYVTVPVLSGVNPLTGAFAGGGVVTLDGSNFDPGSLQVTFDGAAAQLNPAFTPTDTMIQVIVPTVGGTTPTADQSVQVQVVQAGGTSAMLTYTYEIVRLTGVSPAAGAPAGGEIITLSGTGFSEPGLSVLFGTVAATVNSVSADGRTLVVSAPAGTGVVDVNVVSGDGQNDTLVGAYSYAVPAPVVTGLSPSTGPLTGLGTVTLTGSDLDFTAVAVTFDGVASNVISSTPTSVEVEVPAFGSIPAADVAVDVVLTHSGGASAPVSYTYQLLAVSGVTPSTGVPAGGTVVTLDGAGLAETGTTVTFGGVVAGLGSASADGTSLVVTSPAGAGAVDVVVTLSDGQSLVLPAAFTYDTPAPVVTQVTPSTGALAGGSTVTVAGTDLDFASLQVTFGGVPASTVSSSPTSIEVLAPPLGTPSAVDVAVDVVVTHDGGASAPISYTYQVLTLAAPQPTAGPQAGGAMVVLQGTGFTATGTTVTFGGAAATVVGANDAATELTVTTPAGAGTVDVVVTLADGQTTTLAGAYTYSTVSASSVDPAFGNPCGGDVVTITGVGFVVGQMEVTFDGQPASSVVVDPSGTSMAVTTPVVNPLTVEGTPVDVVVTDLQGGQSQTLPGAYTFGFTFIRGDVNDDGSVNPADLAVLAQHVVASGPAPAIRDSADVNDDGLINVGDVTLLSVFLQGGATIPEPFATPGVDPTPDLLCN